MIWYQTLRDWTIALQAASNCIFTWPIRWPIKISRSNSNTWNSIKLNSIQLQFMVSSTRHHRQESIMNNQVAIIRGKFQQLPFLAARCPAAISPWNKGTAAAANNNNNSGSLGLKCGKPAAGHAGLSPRATCGESLKCGKVNLNLPPPPPDSTRGGCSANYLKCGIRRPSRRLVKMREMAFFFHFLVTLVANYLVISPFPLFCRTMRHRLN